MGWLSDNLDFEKFHLSDMWDRLKDDPKRLFLGVDPFSTSIWNTALGRDDQPIMNQLGGPMGGDYLGIGSGGVYDRAQAEGIDTGPAMQMHDIAETVAAFYGGSAAAQGLGNIGGAGAEVGGAAGGGAGAGAGGSGGAVAPAGTGGGGSGSGGLLGGEGGGMFDFGSMDWGSPETYMNLMQMMPQGGMGGQGQQQPQGPQFGRIAGGPGGQAGITPQLSQGPGGLNRQAILGLLAQQTTEDEMKALLGGIL